MQSLMIMMHGLTIGTAELEHAAEYEANHCTSA